MTVEKEAFPLSSKSDRFAAATEQNIAMLCRKGVRFIIRN